MGERLLREPRAPDAAARRPYRASVPVLPRKVLPHDVPAWIDPAKEIYFVTVCCRKRGLNQLAVPEIAEPLVDTIKHRNNRGDWYVHLALLMPDHIHLLVSFPQDRRVQTTISKVERMDCEDSRDRVAAGFLRAPASW